ncbi:MAG: hypothetical protein PUD93_09855 [Lachnospiraceae bacterium]|nr:hypothetical protein [Lachnospiraceae bacterium]
MKIIASATPLANIKQYFEQIGFSPNAAMILDNPSLMREFLRTGYGFAFVPQFCLSGVAAGYLPAATLKRMYNRNLCILCFYTLKAAFPTGMPLFIMY